MQVNEIRKHFLDYFVSKGHTVVASSSLIPYDDPTLLFTNAGMNQFKDVFLGLDKREYVRATSSQKCVRAGGKHNDLENVGYTARHHTFFEMLGNFSFGDYFKLEAIRFAWEFLTVVLKLPQSKLYVTVYHTDDEAFNIWNKIIGLADDRIIRIGDKVGGGSDNFWQMGETGPCGPCSEIFYDHGDHIFGTLPGTPNQDGDRFIEIWNCVFMQFNRDAKGLLHPLPKPSVDTGMGLERISAVMQHVNSNYEIDLFTALIKSASEVTACSDLNNSSLKVLADHIRSISFLIADGAIPLNEGRGYVLRRIIRRAIRHGYKLGNRSAFLHKLVNTLVSQMGEAYPELKQNQQKIEATILQEEKNFFQTIENGMEMLLEELKKLRLTTRVLSGDIAFKLYDTYGFPLDLTEDVSREHDITVDIAGFDTSMQKQKEMAKAAGKFRAGTSLEYTGADTGFIGYNENNIEARVVALYCNNELVDNLNSGESGVVVLDQTVFYAESGGQVGDVGVIQIDGGATLFEISDTQKIRPAVFGHIGNLVIGTLRVGDTINATYDLHKRLATARNHSVTHLLHKALHEVLGEHATQKGSLVCSDYTRFDFANDNPVTKEQIEEIERIVNHVIMMNYPVSTTLMSYDEAIKQGAMALFGEKYALDVRVIRMGAFSTELCGGTHVTRTGDIGFFSISSEIGIASGVRRIEAVTGEKALERMQKNIKIIDNLKYALKAQTNDIITEKVDWMLRDNKFLGKQIDELNSKIAVLQACQYLSRAIDIEGIGKLLVLELNDMDSKVMVELVEALKNRLVTGIVVLGVKNGDKVSIVVGVTKDISAKYNASNIVNYLALQVGGKGGGRPDLAQAGGVDIHKLSTVLSSARKFIEENICRKLM